MPKIIDVHTHIFPDKIAEKASENIGNFYGISMNTKGTVDKLLQRDEKFEITYSVVNSCATISEQVEPINNFILSAISAHQNLRGLITLHPDLTIAQISAQLIFAHKHGFVGVKLHPDFQEFCIDAPHLTKLYGAVDEAGLPILIHTGDKRYERSDPRKLITVARQFPNLRFIAAHFGGYSQWEHVLGYRETPNVYIDTSSSLSFLPKEKAREIIYELGVSRVLFGTDYPMWSPKDELELLMELDLEPTEIEDILYHNAARFFKIEAKV